MDIKYFLVYNGEGKKDIAGVGSFENGTRREVSHSVAIDYDGMEGWTVTRSEPEPQPDPEPDRKRGLPARDKMMPQQEDKAEKSDTEPDTPDNGADDGEISA